MRWEEVDHEWELDVTVVSQHNLDVTLSVLDGIVPSDCSIDEGYRTDTRASARVTTVMPEGESDGYVEDARLRITLSVPSVGWSRELFTGYVTNVQEDEDNGSVTRTYELDSTLFGINRDLIPWQVVCAAGASMLEAVRSLLDLARMPHSMDGAVDRRFGSAVYYERGDSMLHMCFDMTGSTDRIDVDGHGRITVRPYTAPRWRGATHDIIDDDPTTLSVGTARRTSNAHERPGRAIVTATKSEKGSDGKSKSVTIAGWYDSPPESETSSARRGYTIAVKRSYEGTSEEPSQGELNSEAERFWRDSQNIGAEWRRDVIYMDLHEGDIVNFTPHGREPVKCIVATCKTDFGDMTQSLTLEEVRNEST